MAARITQLPSDSRSLWQLLESLTQGEIEPAKADTEDPPWFVSGPFRLFWKIHGQYIARELTAEETVLFCKLSRTSPHL